MKKGYLKNLFIGMRWYLSAAACAFLFFLSFFLPILWYPALLLLSVFAMLTVVDYVMLFAGMQALQAARIVKERIHLGHENGIEIRLKSSFKFPVSVGLVDELPVQFQQRDFKRTVYILPGQDLVIQYYVRPLSRGVYQFGDILSFARGPIGFFERRLRQEHSQVVKVYPSTLFLRRFQLLALSDNSVQQGGRKMQKLGHSMEFEQIKEYVRGDDMRSINWKATARRGSLMANHYIDTRSQQVYALIDKGRTMQMPFDGMTLLDYAINAALIFLNIALWKQDRAGLLTFSAKMHDVLPAERNGKQIGKIQETLYGQTTDLLDSDYQALATTVYRKLPQRSLLLLFANFETLIAMERQLPYLKKLAARHLLCIVIFRNTLLSKIHEQQPDSMEGIYIKTIADRFDYERKQIVKELRRQGILAVLTSPQELTPAIVNKYLEIKSRQMI